MIQKQEEEWKMKDLKAKKIFLSTVLMLMFSGIVPISIAASLATSSATTNYQGVPVGEIWNDTDGNHIQAHGGGFLEYDGWYYWIGEDKSDNTHDTHGANLYRSKDLLNWEFVKTILSDETNPGENTDESPGLVDPETGNFNMERPKLIYDEDSEKFVLFAHWENGENYTASRLLIASSDTIDGHYTIHHNFRPGGFTSRDFNVFQDPDTGEGYLISTQDHENMRVYPLTEDSTNVVVDESYLLFTGQRREAPALIKANGIYYIITSGQSGWYPNQAMYSYTTDISNPEGWAKLQPVGNNTTFYSQPTNIMEVKAKDGSSQYVYMGDRWKPDSIGFSTYVWLPLEINHETKTMTMEYEPGWYMDSDTGKFVHPNVTNVSEGKPVFGEDNVIEGKLLRYINDGHYFEPDTWSPDTKYYQQNKVPWSATIDLEKVYDLARVDFSFKQFNGSEAYYQYTVQGSNNNKDWTLLADESQNKMTGFKSNQLEGKYRYVKIDVTAVKNAHNDNSTASWENGLLEMQVYANNLDREIAALPVVNKEGETYPSEQSITLTSPDSNARIYYTTDGSEPTENSTLYEEPIALTYGETTLKAVSYVDGEESSGILTETYNLIEPDTIVSVVGPTEFAVTADEGASGLPETLEVKNAIGETVTESVHWLTNDIDFTPYHSEKITGTMADGFEVTATVDVINQGTNYFIHGAATEDPFFQAVKKRLGDQLINNVPDQEYDGNWGYTGIIGTDIGSRTSDSTNIYDSGWWAHADKSIDYKINLEPGKYTVISGYKEWWGATRNMKFSAIDSTGHVLDSVEFTTNKDTKAHQERLQFELEQADDVQISVSKVGGSDPVLAWLAVEREEMISIDSLRMALSDYVKSEEIAKPSYKILNNRLTVAEKHYEKNKWNQAIKSLEDFLKHLNNNADNISSEAQEDLKKYSEKLIEQWKE